MDTVEVLAGASTRDRKPIRAYPCPKGNGWHTTSQEERQ